MSDEPYNLRRWAVQPGRLFTCGRPGRGTIGTERREVREDTITRWVNGLPTGDLIQIVSLLGRKRDGYSEFSYYPFRSRSEVGHEPTFQEWLDQRYGPVFVVHEFPTVDLKDIPPDVLSAVKREVVDLIESASTVVIVDSAGSVRSKAVCVACGYKPV